MSGSSGRSSIPRQHHGAGARAIAKDPTPPLTRRPGSRVTRHRAARQRSRSVAGESACCRVTGQQSALASEDSRGIEKTSPASDPSGPEIGGVHSGVGQSWGNPASLEPARTRSRQRSPALWTEPLRPAASTWSQSSRESWRPAGRHVGPQRERPQGGTTPWHRCESCSRP
jgi:hypothetical protein